MFSKLRGKLVAQTRGTAVEPGPAGRGTGSSHGGGGGDNDDDDPARPARATTVTSGPARRIARLVAAVVDGRPHAGDDPGPAVQVDGRRPSRSTTRGVARPAPDARPESARPGGGRTIAPVVTVVDIPPGPEPEPGPSRDVEGNRVAPIRTVVDIAPEDRS